MIIEAFFDKTTATVTYIITDESTNYCAIIDPVLNYTPESGKISTQSADNLIKYILDNQLTLEWILETHLHADHLTAADYIKSQLGGQIGISEYITDALAYWTPIFNTINDTSSDGTQFDKHFKDQEVFYIGDLPVKVLHTPGHTPVCISYLINDAIFVGDTIFMPYMGTSRADFPGGDAKTLYHSIQRIFALPPETRIFTCHDYPAENQPACWESSVEEQKKKNVLINDSIDEQQFIVTRTMRDKTLAVPRLLLPALQVNLRAGKLAKAEANGVQYMKIPINML